MKLTLAAWRQLARIGHAASEDEKLPILTKLQLRREGSTVTAQASDSYIAARTSTTVIEIDGVPDKWEGLVSARQALLVEKDVRSLDRYRSKKDVPDGQIVLEVTVAEEWMDVTLAEDGTLLGPETVSRRLSVATGEKYPQVGDLIDAALKVEPGGYPVLGINPELVERVCKSSGWDEEGQAVVFHFGEFEKPIGLRLTDRRSQWAGLLMPVRMT